MQSSMTSASARGRHGDHGERDVGRDVAQARPGAAATDRLVRRVDREHRRRSPTPVTLRHSTSPTEPGPIAGADDGDRARQQEPGHRPGVGTLLAPLDGVEELLGVVEREVEVDDAALEAPLDRPAGAAEHRQHRPVVGEHLGGEAVDAVGAGDRREVLEQQRGDALALVLVVDHEGGVGVVAAGPPLVAGPGDELAVALDDQGHAVDEVDVGEVLEVGFGQLRLRREVAPVDALGGLPLVERGERRRVGRADRPDVRRLAVAEDDVAGPALVRASRRSPWRR